MKIIPLLYIVALLLTSVVWGAVTDIVIGQRAGSNQRFVQRVITGNANPLKPVGFSSDGVFTAMSQIRGISLRTPDGVSNIDLTTNGAVKITANSVDSINVSQRSLINNTGDDTLDWQNRNLLFNWSVQGSLKVGSEIVTGEPLNGTSISTQLALNTTTVSSNTSFTFSSTPPIGQVFGLEVRNSSDSAVTISFPTSKDSNTGSTVNSFTLLASPGLKVVNWRYTGTEYIIYQGGGGGGSVEVSSSSTSTTDNLVSFSDTTGKVIKDSGETVASLKARANHTGQQAWNTINGLPTTLAGYGITDGQPVNTNLNSISLLSDPNVDRLLFWDDSTSSWKHLTLGTNLSITDTTLNAATGVVASSIADYPINNSPTVESFTEIYQSGSSTRSTLGQIKSLILDNPVLTGDASVQGILTATKFSGSGDELTKLPADQIFGTLPDLGTGILTTSSSKKILPVVGVSNAINTANGETTIALDATTETLSYSATPSTGTYFSYTLEGHSAASVVTIPSTYSFALGGFRTSFTAPASKPTSITVRRDAGRYVMWGDPVDIGDLSNNLSPTTSGKLEIDQGSGSEYITLNQVKTLTSTSPTFTGIVTNSGATANTAAAMAANAIDVTKELNTKTVTTATTFTFTGTPVTNQWFGLYVKNYGASDATVTFPVSKDSVTGVTITTSTVAATTGRQHLYWRYDGSEYIIYRGSSGGVGAGDAQLNGGNNWTGNQNVLGTVTATTFSGEGTLLDNIPGSAINGPIPDIEVDTLTTDNIRVITPTLVSGNVLDVTKGWLYKPLTADISLTFSDNPATGSIMWVEFICDSTARSITLPTAVYSDDRGSQVTQFTAQANTRPLISFIKLADGWRAQGIPTQISNLPAVTSPDTAASIEIDQGTGSRRTTLANIKTALSLDTSRTGTHTLPSTVNPLSPAWTGPFHTIYYGSTGAINLPAASAYTDRGIIIYNTGNFTITVDASGSEVIVRDGVIQTGGVSFTLSTGAGNFVNLISDGTRWITLGYKGTLTQGS